MKDIFKGIYFGFQAKLNLLCSKEPEWLALATFLKPGDIFIDVGSNIGRYSTRAARLVGSEGHVFSLDPSLESSLIHTIVISFTRLTNITHLRVAASHSVSCLGFAMMRSKPPSAIFSTYTTSRLSRNSSSPSSYSVYAYPLDLLFASLPHIDFLKIDVEGSELDVLHGSTSIIKRFMPTILIENNSQDCTDYLLQLGYRVCDTISEPSRNLLFTYTKN